MAAWVDVTSDTYWNPASGKFTYSGGVWTFTYVDTSTSVDDFFWWIFAETFTSEQIRITYSISDINFAGALRYRAKVDNVDDYASTYTFDPPTAVTNSVATVVYTTPGSITGLDVTGRYYTLVISKIELYTDWTPTVVEPVIVDNTTRELVLDLTLQSFYTHTIAKSVPYVVDYVDVPSYVTSVIEEQVYVSGEAVIDSNDSTVVIDSDVAVGRVSQFLFLTIEGVNFTLSQYRDTTFKDWETYGVGVDFSSYLVTGYETFGDILRHKQVPYVWFYFQRTEDGFTEVDNVLEINNPSSCLVQAQWNWTNSANSGQWGNQFQAYRLPRNYVPSGPSDIFDYGYEVVVTKNKLRGSGRCLSLKIQSEEGKDMKLLGWGLLVNGDSRP